MDNISGLPTSRIKLQRRLDVNFKMSIPLKPHTQLSYMEYIVMFLYKAFKGTVVNQVLASCMEGHLKLWLRPRFFERLLLTIFLYDR